MGAMVECTLVPPQDGNGSLPSSLNQTLQQYIPAHYTHWLVHSLLPGNDYSCEMAAFDQYGRWAERQYGPAAVGRTREPAPKERPVISYVRVRDTPEGDFTTMVDWGAIELGGGEEEGSNRTVMGGPKRDRGYRIFVYESETAQLPIILQLAEAELHDPRQPSARIDGLRTMQLYRIEVAGYNPGGVGPRSAAVPVRIGASAGEGSQSEEFGKRNSTRPNRALHTVEGLLIVCALLYSHVVFSFRLPL